MNGNPANILPDHFALAGVETGADFDAERLCILRNSAGTADAPRRTVEGGKNTVAGRLDLMSAKACQVAPDRGVMIVEQIAPAVVASAATFSVEPTMSVKSTMASTRSSETDAREPVKNPR